VRLASRLIARMRGEQPHEPWSDAKLAESLPANGPREFYQPISLENGAAKPLKWKGSADVFTLARANALLVRAENEPAQSAGAAVRVLEV
jgi:molybdopterin molybdotransferase